MIAICLALLPLAACRMLTGGPLTVDVNRDDVKQMAIFALGELNTLLKSQSSLAKIVSAKTQVVAGTNYILSLQLQQGGAERTKVCNVTVWSRPWLPDTRLTHHWCYVNKRSMRSALQTEIDPNRSDVKSMVKYVISQIASETGITYEVDSVTSAWTQPVGVGTSYELRLRLKDGPVYRAADATVWYQPLTNSKNMTRHKLYPTYALSQVSTSYDEVKQAAIFAVDQINGVDETQFKLDEIISAEAPSMISYAFQSYLLLLRLSENNKVKVCKVMISINLGLDQMSMTERSCKLKTKRDSP